MATTQQPILPPGPTEFPFEWEEEGDASLSWEWDNMHSPTPLAPLAADYMRGIAQGFAYRYATLDVPMEVLARIWNGYAYFAARFGAPETEVMERLTAAKRAVVATTAAYWNERSLPELRDTYAAIDATDPAPMPADALAHAWEAAWRGLDRAWSVHFRVISGAYQVLEDLADRYEALVPDAAAGDALRLVQGGVNELQDVGAGIERLVDLARADDGLATRLRAGDHDPPSDGPFAEALAAFLARHGHLGQGWDDLQLASWGEEPRQLMAEIAKQLDRPGERVADRRARLAADAGRVLDDVRARLADRTDELADFEALLAAAREIGPITETHNYWIDRMAQATIRRLVTRVGHRLVGDGVIGAVEDVFYLGREEVAELVRGPRAMHDEVAARRREHEHQRTIVPPPWVGMPPEGAAGRFDAPEARAAAADEIRGAGASPGVARGPARVTLGQGDFGRIQPGDVIVCPSSNPSWVPLFSIAAALVTDTGGVLSHAAVVAREFGLPAVVGTREGTTRISDGQIVEVDGAAGIVRLL
jgi:pyruvate,water dikinase